MEKNTKKQLAKKSGEPIRPELETKSPWVNWSDSVRELFKRDPDIKNMTWSDDTLELHIYVLNPLKRIAIRELLPEVKVFDKTKVTVRVLWKKRKTQSVCVRNLENLQLEQRVTAEDLRRSDWHESCNC